MDQRPLSRHCSDGMVPIATGLDLDLRNRATAKMHVDFFVRFDGNSYTSPPWTVGRQVSSAADYRTVTVYYKRRRSASLLLPETRDRWQF